MRLIPSLLGGSRYRAGDWVIVRSREEILATLDSTGCLDELPLQAEMLDYCGRQLQVFKVAHKTCDYSAGGADGRRMRRAVHLLGARCDGSAHDGCQAHCYMFWRDEWLKPAGSKADRGAAPRAAPSPESDKARQLTSQRSIGPHGGKVFVCQTTELRKATTPLAFWDPRQYVDDVTSGNLRLRDALSLILSGTLRELLRYGYGYRLLKSIHDKIQLRIGNAPYFDYVGPIPAGTPTPTGQLGVQPGEVVEVRPWDEIKLTLDGHARNRGLRFDYEMAKFCGKRFRVEARVDRIIDEKTGVMLKMKEPCIQLEGVHCMAQCTADRLGCPRRGRIFWRELWLRRSEGRVP